MSPNAQRGLYRGLIVLHCWLGIKAAGWGGGIGLQNIEHNGDSLRRRSECSKVSRPTGTVPFFRRAATGISLKGFSQAALAPDATLRNADTARDTVARRASNKRRAAGVSINERNVATDARQRKPQSIQPKW